MTCAELLADLRDHAAGGEPAEELTRHLGTCAACASTLQAERHILDEVDTVLAAVAQTEPSPVLLARARALADRPVAGPPHLHGLRIAAVFLAVAFSAAVLLRLDWGRAPATGPSALGSPPPSADRPVAAAPASGSTARAVPPPAPAPTPRRVLRTAVLVPGGQEAMLRQYAALVESGAVEVPPRTLERDEPSLPLDQPAPLHLPPLTISPIEADEAPSED